MAYISAIRYDPGILAGFVSDPGYGTGSLYIATQGHGIAKLDYLGFAKRASWFSVPETAANHDVLATLYSGSASVQYGSVRAKLAPISPCNVGEMTFSGRTDSAGVFRLPLPVPSCEFRVDLDFGGDGQSEQAHVRYRRVF